LKCKKPLTLLWDLDLGDSLIVDYVRVGFAPATRLPFFICWRCVAASYSVLSDSSVKCFPFDNHSETLEEYETPFLDNPLELARRPIKLQPISSTLDALISLADVVGYEQLDQSAREMLTQEIGRDVDSDYELPMSQFGGSPFVRHRNMICPNPKCPASELTHPYGELETPYLMKELALIHWNEEPSLAEACFQLVYYVCGICFSMRCEYRSS
jgi:hypothetical protein